MENKNATISTETLNNLKSTGLFSSIIPKEFGGLGMNKTQFCKYNEGISPSASILNCNQFYGTSVNISLLIILRDSQRL